MNKELINSSLQLHLSTFEAFGLRDVLRDTPSLETSQHTPALEDIRSELGDCQLCPLASQRQNIVFGAGNPKAEIMFIGEAPGADEDEQGLPFVGVAGQLLTKMIEAMGLKRDDVYIANVIKCRPPGNRNPEPVEVEACSPFLKKQILTIQPKIIVTLGKFATQYVCDTQIPISKLRGQWRDFQGIPVMPTFHPSYLLRNAEMKRPAWQDLQKVMQALKATN